jgi:hypothetical protein
MEVIPESFRMKKPTNCPLRASVLVLDACHQDTASTLGIDIGHFRHRAEDVDLSAAQVLSLGSWFKLLATELSVPSTPFINIAQHTDTEVDSRTRVIKFFTATNQRIEGLKNHKALGWLALSQVANALRYYAIGKI